MDRVAVDEIVALKAEVASLKLQNESLEIRLLFANDTIVSLRQFCEGETAMRRAGEAVLEATQKSLDAALQSQRSLSNLRDHYQGEAEKFRKELMRRGADDPRKPKPPCDTVFAALQEVSKWDRDACFADLRKQRAEHLRRIDALRAGRELQMDDVVDAMNAAGCYPKMGSNFWASLPDVLCELKKQLWRIWDDTPPALRTHEEWFQEPLSNFMAKYDSESEGDESMEEDVA
jgi:hypothetical protein